MPADRLKITSLFEHRADPAAKQHSLLEVQLTLILLIMGAKGTYSLMSIPDIINSLGDWGLTVEEDRLLRPTSEFVEFVFCACLAQVTGINREDLLQPAQDALSISSLEDKVRELLYTYRMSSNIMSKDNIYLSALTHNLLCYHLTRFANAARVDDFSSYDISKPTKERTLLLLSAFINFVKFTEQLCNPFVNELVNRSNALLVDRDQVSSKLAQTQKQIQELKSAFRSLYQDSYASQSLHTEPNEIKMSQYVKNCERRTKSSVT